MTTLTLTMYSELLLVDPEVSLFHSLLKRMNLLDGIIVTTPQGSLIRVLGNRNIEYTKMKKKKMDTLQQNPATLTLSQTKLLIDKHLV
ncbi:hypothetical protein F2Q68_00023802 [Brassica cretica]|uniref:Uncharacterized protein n=1 Tax=Brassica cretica TaxID=69181 RepID=A0A8S9IFF7_BRACR|nr:hypothetical protein F2Q68_00023802 [Brassica cretica]